MSKLSTIYKNYGDISTKNTDLAIKTINIVNKLLLIAKKNCIPKRMDSRLHEDDENQNAIIPAEV